MAFRMNDKEITLYHESIIVYRTFYNESIVIYRTFYNEFIHL
ncbi:MAG: hypothetical protein ACI88H_003867 [Cocleimonas sp.]|jgi:hypothetical protein